MKRLGAIAAFYRGPIFFPGRRPLAQKGARRRPDEKTKILPPLRVGSPFRISDIDERFASWERQTASIHKLQQPRRPEHPERTLRYRQQESPRLKAKSRRLQAELAECQKKCASTDEAFPWPMTPRSRAAARPAAVGAAAAVERPAVERRKVGRTASRLERRQSRIVSAQGCRRTKIIVGPGRRRRRAYPRHRKAKGRWIIGNICWAIWPGRRACSGDDLDVDDVLDDLEDSITDAYDELAENPAMPTPRHA